MPSKKATSTIFSTFGMVLLGIWTFCTLGGCSTNDVDTEVGECEKYTGVQWLAIDYITTTTCLMADIPLLIFYRNIPVRPPPPWNIELYRGQCFGQIKQCSHISIVKKMAKDNNFLCGSFKKLEEKTQLGSGQSQFNERTTSSTEPEQDSPPVFNILLMSYYLNTK